MAVSIESLVGTIKSPIENGDAGLVIKPDGSIYTFNTFGVTDARDFTPEQLQTAETLLSLSLALRIPAVMDILKQMLNDGDIVEQAKSDRN